MAFFFCRRSADSGTYLFTLFFLQLPLKSQFFISYLTGQLYQNILQKYDMQVTETLYSK